MLMSAGLNTLIAPAALLSSRADKSNGTQIYQLVIEEPFLKLFFFFPTTYGNVLCGQRQARFSPTFFYCFWNAFAVRCQFSHIFRQTLYFKLCHVAATRRLLGLLRHDLGNATLWCCLFCTSIRISAVRLGVQCNKEKEEESAIEENILKIILFCIANLSFLGFSSANLRVVKQS